MHLQEETLVGDPIDPVIGVQAPGVNRAHQKLRLRDMEVAEPHHDAKPPLPLHERDWLRSRGLDLLLSFFCLGRLHLQGAIPHLEQSMHSGMPGVCASFKPQALSLGML